MKIAVAHRNEVTQYAADELAKYVRLITRCEIMPSVEYLEQPFICEGLEDTLVLGLCEELKLDTSDVDDAFVDDVIDIKVKNGCGYIAGSNDRSILMGVYKFCTSAGCRFIRPGENGEYVPYCDLTSHEYTYRKKADHPFRGECCEGAISYEHMRDTVYWMPKVGMNMYMIEGIVPYTYMHKWYGHVANKILRPSGQVTDYEMLEEYIEKLENDIRKTGVQLHAVGHAWMFEKFGVRHRDPVSEARDMAKLTDEQLSYTALVNGQRGLYHNSTFFTHFCYSNPAARKLLVDFCVEYVQKKPYIDFLHVWLADNINNQCECENCAKMTPSDHYVVLLNEIEEALSKINAKTRLVFIMYNDTVRPPERMVLKNPESFTMVVAIGAPYDTGYVVDKFEGEVPPFERNKYKTHPLSLRMRWHDEWKKLNNDINSFVFEYRFYNDHYCDPGYMHVSRETYRDMRSLSDVNLQGCINDQTHRIYLPTSLPMLTMAYTLFDRDVDFDAMADDYFLSAFGEDGASVREYLEELSVLFCPKNQRHYNIIEVEDISLTSGTKSNRSFINNKDAEEKFAKIPDLLEAFLPTIKKNMASDEACHRLSWVYLNYHSKICARLSKIFLLGAQNKLEEARVLIDALETELSLMEESIHNAFDVFLFIRSLRSKFGIKMCGAYA